MPRKYDDSPDNAMNEEFEEYNEEYEAENDEGFERPTDSIRRRLMQNSQPKKRRGFEKKEVNFGRRSNGGRFGERKSLFGSKPRGLPKKEKSSPLNRTRGKSPFTYRAGICLSRFAKGVDECECDEMEFPEEYGETEKEYPGKSRKSWGVPWKR